MYARNYNCNIQRITKFEKSNCIAKKERNVAVCRLYNVSDSNARISKGQRKVITIQANYATMYCLI